MYANLTRFRQRCDKPQSQQYVSEMKLISKVVFSILVYCEVPAIGTANTESAREILTYYGASDASAAVSVSEDTFIVADDENNVLRFYKTNQAGLPVFSYDLTQFLGVTAEYPEADIEGATMIGDRIYWITSHGRNKDGKMRPNRHRFFATTIKSKNGKVTIEPVGRPCKTLVRSLLETNSAQKLGLNKATCLHIDQSEKLAPKKQGLNIEALCASADKKIIYIGFRNPRPAGKAILIPLHNPRRIIKATEKPRFGKPLLWDLKGLGIRAMKYSTFHKAYFIIAGSHNGHGAPHKSFYLYRWSGKKEKQPVLVRQINLDKYNLNPEALVSFETSARFLLVSDDGNLAIDVSDASECLQGKLRKDGKCPNKYLTDRNKKHFRAIWLEP